MCCRDGGVDEAGGSDGCRADGGGAQPAVGRLQERDRGTAGQLAHHQQHRAEGGEQELGGEVRHDSHLPHPGQLRAADGAPLLVTSRRFFITENRCFL